ncbi:MAG TPA: DUF4124 domain-containing protein [Burkholderiales bacterium]|nr:DUF4124 domain-containing protein [Burkholderiales bacterium]
MTAIKGIVALILACGAATAAAETVYKYRRPGGETVYSDAPVLGAKLIGRFDLVPAPAPAPSAEPGPGPAVAAGRREAELDAADAQIKAADRDLTGALERQQQDMEPLPGERRGNADGHSRLTPGYFERQRAAAAAVDAARAELDAAYRLKNEVRE